MTTAAALTASTLDDIRTTAPQVPTTLEETGLTTDMIEQLLVKTLYGGELTGLMLAERLRLPFTIIEPIIERLRIERLIEVRGGTSTASYRYTPTDLGRDRAPAVSRDQPVHRRGACAARDLCRPDARARRVARISSIASGCARASRTSSSLTLCSSNSGRPRTRTRRSSCTGPQATARRCSPRGSSRTLGGDMYMPYAIEIEGHIITMYDPISHEALDADVPDATSIIAAAPRDRRWVRIRRPVVIVGGELTLDMLDLTFNPLAKFYDAPLQLKANGGIFLVDDFGRQRMRPEDLLNRWIVPLESRVDYLTLHTGKKFQVPFDVLTVFATNLDPASLADEAFLRRIPYKIAIQDPSIEDFTRILEMNCRRRDLRFHPVMAAYLQRRHYLPINRPLRACHPRDLLDQVTALCRYRGHRADPQPRECSTRRATPTSSTTRCLSRNPRKFVHGESGALRSR